MSMRLQKYILSLVGWVPRPVKRIIVGSRSNPSKFANRAHTALNWLPVDRYPVLNCKGPLKGFRMKVDWKKHRSFAYGGWEPEVVETIRRHVVPGMNALDLGAQSGFYSLLLSKLVGPSGSVTAFEPLPANARILRENLKINNVGNVTVREEAVTARPGTLRLEVPDDNSDLLAGPLAPDDEQSAVIVPAISLDAFAREDGRTIHFIKMDVEGFEDDVLEGASEILKDCHPVMLIELHNLDGHTLTHDVISRLDRLGYCVERVGELKWTAHIFARWGHRKGSV